MKEMLKKEIGVRMRQVRKALGFTQEKIVAHFNIGRANYSRIEKGEVFPNPSMLNTLRTEFNVSLDWLITNTGSMFFPEPVNNKSDTIDLETYSAEVRELLQHMQRLPMVKHAVLGFFLEYKIEHKKIIQEAFRELKRTVGNDNSETL